MYICIFFRPRPSCLSVRVGWDGNMGDDVPDLHPPGPPPASIVCSYQSSSDAVRNVVRKNKRTTQRKITPTQIVYVYVYIYVCVYIYICMYIYIYISRKIRTTNSPHRLLLLCPPQSPSTILLKLFMVFFHVPLLLHPPRRYCKHYWCRVGGGGLKIDWWLGVCPPWRQA